MHHRVRIIRERGREREKEEREGDEEEEETGRNVMGCTAETIDADLDRENSERNLGSLKRRVSALRFRKRKENVEA